jgi:hypothetical protein
MEDNEINFEEDLKALSGKYIGCKHPGYRTIWYLSVAIHRNDTDRLVTMDNFAGALELEYFHEVFHIPEPVELLKNASK